MTFNWDSVPALRILLPFIAGIGLATFLNYHYFRYEAWCVTLSLLLCLPVLLVWQRPLQERRYEWIFGLIGSLALVGLGYIDTVMQNSFYNDPRHFANYVSDSSFVIARLIEPVAEKERTYKAVVEVAYLSENNRPLQSVKGKAIVYLQKDSSSRAATLQYGDLLLTNATFQRVKGSLNPAGFDYAAYLAMSDIYHQAYASDISWVKLGQNESHAFWRWVYNLRSYCIDAIEQYVDSGDPYRSNQVERAVALALLIGNTDLIDDDILQAYSHTGAMHILAVSGMHVVIFWGLLNWVLGFLDKRGRKGRLFKAALCLFAIWTFALVSGFSPSVARAAVMFSLVLVGQQLDYRANIYNTMAVAALLLLIAQPLTLFHVGLQLSFLAVLGIVYFQSKIGRLFAFTTSWGYKISLFCQAFLPLSIARNHLGKRLTTLPAHSGKYMGEMAATTIAAQIATMPLTLYYFHQFPVYFLIANLLVVPLSGLALYCGFSLLFFAKWCDSLAILAGKATYLLIYLTNSALLFIGKLPGAVVDGFSISWYGMLLLYAMTALLTAFFLQKEARFLKAAMLLAIVGLWGIVLKQYHVARQHEIVFYHIANGTAIDLIAGPKAISVSDSIGATNKSTTFYKQPYRWQLGINTVVELPLDTLQWGMASNADNSRPPTFTYKDSNAHIWGPMVTFGNRKILLFDKAQAQYDPTDTLSVDYLYLCKNPYVDLTCLAEKVNFRRVVMDASNSQWRINSWEYQLEKLGIAYYSIKNNKALVLKW